MDKKYLIGEFSDMSGISKRMLRHYDKLGLFCPMTLNEDSGYRYYSEEQITELNKIQFLRELGFTLGSISDLLEKPIDLTDFIERLKEKEVELTSASDELKTSLMLAKRTILYLEKQSPKTFPSINQLLNIEGSMKMKSEVQKQVMEQLDLKQLINRDVFLEKIEMTLRNDQEDVYHMITFDIDHFMHVNDIDGYDVGDLVIQTIFAKVIRCMKALVDQAPENNLVARLGGDECSFFLKNADDDLLIHSIKQAFEDIRSFDFTEIGCSRNISISCGIAYGKKPIHIAQLKDQSVKALIEAKRNGRDQYAIMTY